jgi:hypothetical protein
MEKQILRLSIRDLRNEELYGLISLVMTEFMKCDDPRFQTTREALAKCLSALNAVLERARKSPYTLRIAAADDRRDFAYRALLERIYARYVNPEKIEAARQVDEVLSRYDNPVSLPYVQENGVILNIVEDLDTPEMRANLALLDALEWLEELRASNDAFITLFTARNEEQAAAYDSVPPGAVREARLALAGAYQACVTRINALAEVEGPEAYASMISAVNQLTRRQEGVIGVRSARHRKADEPETENEDK